MANFYYKAIDNDKRISEGQMSAKSRDEVAQIIAKKGLSPLVIKITQDKMVFKGSIPQIEKITFCRYLSIMLSTGLSLSEGIDVLRRETKNPLMYKILGDMSYSLEQGQQLSTIFERYPNIFESYFLTLTRAGEVSGKLSEVFKYLESELRSEYSLNSKVKGALLYPAVITMAMLGIGLLMFFFVLPQVGRVFLSMNLPLPPITRFMFEASIALNKQMIPLIICGLVLGVIGFYLLKNKNVRDALFLIVKPVPFIHNLLVKIDLARFSRIFSTLLKSAVPITDALEISFHSLSMREYRVLATKFPDEIKRGKSLSTLVRESKIFPSLVTQMVAAGEKTATLDVTLADLATFYEGEVEEEVGSLTQIIEPMLVLCIGIAVGAMILSIISPIYSVVSNLQQAAGSSGASPH
jgi:type IV pilus assembly protein PilC